MSSKNVTDGIGNSEINNSAKLSNSDNDRKSKDRDSVANAERASKANANNASEETKISSQSISRKASPFSQERSIKAKVENNLSSPSDGKTKKSPQTLQGQENENKINEDSSPLVLEKDPIVALTQANPQVSLFKRIFSQGKASEKSSSRFFRRINNGPGEKRSSSYTNQEAEIFSGSTLQSMAIQPTEKSKNVFQRLCGVCIRPSKQEIQTRLFAYQRSQKSCEDISEDLCNEYSDIYCEAREFRSDEMSREYYSSLDFPTIVITKPSTESLPLTESQMKMMAKRKMKRASQKQN